MSSYNRFISDFPKRCNDLLDKYFLRTKAHDPEVTLMLAIATAGFVIPFERLSKEYHPTQDRERYQEAAAKLDAILNIRFLESDLWTEPPASWVYTKKVQDEQLELDFWPELKNPRPLKDNQAGSVLKHLRNALAHGNIFTRGNPIDLLVFLSRPSKDSPKFAMLAVAPSDFHKFLHNWFSFLGKLKMPADIYENQLVA